MRVAWVVPRYGAEIGGGAEELCRRTVGLLADDIESTIVTTCALDYQTWADHYPAGETVEDGIRVLRFPVRKTRDPSAFERISQDAYARPDDLALGREWMRAQGPHSPALLEHLEATPYDVVAFMPYLYATTGEAIASVSDHAVLVPCAHDEPPLRLTIFEGVFAAARGLVYNAPEEKEAVERRFGVDGRPQFVIGLAVEQPPTADPERFKSAYGVDGPYLLCLGRVEPSKGSVDAIARFGEVRRRRPDLSLVLMGRPHMEVPDVSGLVVTGFVDEETKHDALAGAAVVLLPSPYESLSIAALEAWSHGRPTLANGAADVLRGQTVRSNGGLWYSSPAEFHVTLELLLDNPPLAETLGLQGRRWVEATTSRDLIRARWLEALRTAAA